MKQFIRRCSYAILKTCNITLLLGIVAGIFLLLGVGSVLTWEYTNSSEFCANACHAVHPEEPAAYRDSYHARVKCTECHMGRVSTLRAIFVKATHMKHLWSRITGGYDRPLTSRSMRPANESCERCHWPQAFHDQRLREIEHFKRDENSTKISTRLALNTGGGTAREGRGKGIHWHVENKVRYIAADEQKQQIPWVEVTHQDGSKTSYMDVTRPLSAEEIKQSPKRLMDCVDCHNRVGHPFENPEVAVDRAISLERLDRRLPFVKAWAMRLLSIDYTTEEDALQLVEATREAYRYDYPEFYASYPEAIRNSESAMKNLLRQIKFKYPGISWRSFPDSTGHTHFPGCFRCHNGKHINKEGESIRLHCNICHDIPTVYREGDAPLVYAPMAIDQPPSHLEPNFIRDHRFLANDRCASCHIEVKFGTDNTSFCANPACHGAKWEYVDLDATAPHPFVLEGKHKETWCHQCHQGVKHPNPACESCHKPPVAHEFDSPCANCHDPVGWSESIELLTQRAPKLSHPDLHSEGCLTCHGTTSQSPFPADHKDYSIETCPKCHEKYTPKPIPHPIAGREQCFLCHKEGPGPTAIPEDHQGRKETQCILCHAALKHTW